MVLGICGFLLSCVWLGILAGIPAVICGHMAMSQIRKNPLRVGGHGMAVAGLVLGYFTVVLFFAMIGLILVSFAKASSPAIQGIQGWV